MATAGWRLAFALLMTPGCAKDVECVARVTDGARTFEGKATGKRDGSKDLARLERDALRDACRGMCGGDGACVARCVTDVSAGKLGGQVECR
jgi:hypothetical protein